MFDWDDLRIFLAAARSGSLAAAGEKLGVNTATVGRRIARLETALKSTLLVRSRSGLQLTAVGAQLLATGVEAENAMERAARVAHPDVVAGTVRISAAEGFGTAILAPALPALAVQRPGLRVELAAIAGFLSPSRREVDMAITLSAPHAHRLVGEPLTKYQLALYASPGYLARRGAPTVRADLAGHQIVGYVSDLIYAAELRYLDEILPGLTPTLASTSIRAQGEMIRADGGIGVMHCFMAEGLVRVLPEVLLERRLWLSTYAEVHDTARMRVVRNWLREVTEENRDRLAPYEA
jgi:DNA-binding transcriptional LysR family regulator